MSRQNPRRRRFAQRGFMSVIMAGICVIFTLMLTATILISGMVKQRTEQQAQADAVALARGIIAKEQGLTAICNHPGLQRLMEGNSPRLTQVDCEAAIRDERPDGTTGLRFRANVDGDVSADTPVFGPNQRWRLDSSGTAEVQENLFEDVELRFPKLALVLDYSGSMQCSFDAECSRYDFARVEALRAAVRTLIELDLPIDLGAIAFSTNVRVVVPPEPGNAAEMEALLAYGPDGWTNYATAIERATALLEATPPGGRFLAIVSDGSPTRPGSSAEAERAALDAASAAEAAGITRFAVNLTAVQHSREVLIEIAGGPARYFEALDAESTGEVMREIGSRVTGNR